MKINELLTESVVQQVKDWLNDRRNRKFQKIWDKKSDEDILTAYDDASEWLQLEGGFRGKFHLPDTLKAGLEMRMNTYILPQMEKRGLQSW